MALLCIDVEIVEKGSVDLYIAMNVQNFDYGPRQQSSLYPANTLFLELTE